MISPLSVLRKRVPEYSFNTLKSIRFKCCKTWSFLCKLPSVDAVTSAQIKVASATWKAVDAHLFTNTHNPRFPLV